MLYDFLSALLRPVASWGRLRVEGLDLVPEEGPLLVVPNHDSQWDPILVALAIKPRRRLRFLARASLWKIPGLAPILYVGFARLDVVPEPAERIGSTAELVGMALITMCLGVTAASFYEIYEWVVDNWFGQHLFIAEGDTVNDLADGFLGAAIGGLFLAAWAEFRYTSRRFPARVERILNQTRPT